MSCGHFSRRTGAQGCAPWLPAQQGLRSAEGVGVKSEACKNYYYLVHLPPGRGNDFMDEVGTVTGSNR